MVRISNVETHVYGSNNCDFGGHCVSKPENIYNESRVCRLVEILLDGTEQFQKAKDLGLQPAKVPTIWYTGTDPEADSTRISLCQKVSRDPKVIQGLKELLSSTPNIFVDESDKIAELREVDQIYSGEIQDIDGIHSEAGMEALEKLTSTEGEIYSSGQTICIDNGQITTIPVYE
jgi:hypothetical protein